MSNQEHTAQEHKTYGAWEQIGKVLVATFAAICAALAPRVITALSTSDPNAEIHLFSESYLQVVVIVCVAIGVGAMLVTWRLPFDPPKIFTIALSFPALVSGGWNMSAGVQNAANISLRETDRSKVVLEQQDIPILAPVPALDLKMGLYQQPAQRGLASIELGFFSSARAAEPGDRAYSSPNISQVIVQQKYLVTLGSYGDKRRAERELHNLQRIVPRATLATIGGTYYLVASPTPSTITGATRLATSLKNQFTSTQRRSYPIGLLPLGR